MKGRRQEKRTPPQKPRQQKPRQKFPGRGRPQPPYELELIHQSGRKVWVEVREAPVTEDGKTVAVVGSLTDITEWKHATEALRKSEQEFRELYDNAPIGYHEYDTNGIVTRVNRTEAEMLGYKVDEMLGQPIWNFIAREENVKPIILGKLSGAIPPGHAYERRYLKKAGSTLFVLAENKLLKNDKGDITGVRTIIQDISERKKLENEMAALQERLRQSQKLEAIGLLAGGIAHDFNNILTIISGSVQLALMDNREGDPLGINLEEIKKASDRATDLIRQLLAFGRKQIMEVRILNLNQVLQELDTMLRRLIGEDILLEIIPAEPLGKVKADPGQIEQVIMNISVNARGAMPAGGKLTIETANVELDEEYAGKHVGVKPGQYVMLSISDTGRGMPPEEKDRIFEPFFTTKEKGKGTGLGLSTVYGIVKQSGGNIWVYSELGKGTSFKIYLPMVEEPLTETWEKTAGKISRGTETILVVEDEETVRDFVLRVLERQGYKVLEAESGGSAIALCENYMEPIHLILTDVVMPGMSGRELAEHLRKIHPETKALYMSGYTDNAILHHGILEPGIRFIQKPFTVEGLTNRVREVLDKSK